MTYQEAKETCHVRSAIFRKGDPTKIYTEEDLAKSAFPALNKNRIGTIVPKVYWKDHPVSLDSRIPDIDKLYNDWEEYDPREQEECSSYNEKPA